MGSKATVSLKIGPRSINKKKVSQLRRQGIIPGVICGKDIDSLRIQVDGRELESVYNKTRGTSIVTLMLDDESIPALIHGIQRDNLSHKMLHVDFLKVGLKDHVTLEVPLVFTGVSPAEKEGLGKIGHEVTKIHIKCLPSDIPSEIQVDISSIKDSHDVIHAGDLKLPEGANLGHGVSEEKVIATLTQTRVSLTTEEAETGEAAASEAAAPEE